MSIAKFDLYNPEWLELVFDDRNKMYGAYDLRKHYASNLVKAMGIAFFSVALLYTGYEVLKPKASAVTVTTIYDPLIKPLNYVKPPEVVTPPRTQTIKPPTQISTVRYPIYVVKPDKLAEEPPTTVELTTAAISTTTEKGKNDGGINIDIPQGDGSGLKNITEGGDEPVDVHSVEVEPQPYGGAEAWSKFLQKNIHYPPVAVENNVQGKVFLSFIVERDGKLSNIEVTRGVGSGLDEEATRVLKLAPAWKPGIQNGHPVRVKYTIPINFQLADPNN